MPQACVHATLIEPVPAPRDGCEACLAIGGTWVHLRQCLTCGRTLCCDSSPNMHASRHAREADHPIVRGADPGDDWTWCFADEELIRPGASGWEFYDPPAGDAG
jgi:hypothetical protein